MDHDARRRNTPKAVLVHLMPTPTTNSPGATWSMACSEAQKGVGMHMRRAQQRAEVRRRI